MSNPIPPALTSIEQSIDECQQIVHQWLSEADLIPSVDEAKALSARLSALTELPLQIETTEGPVKLTLATLDQIAAANLPTELWQRLQLLNAQIVLFQQDLERFTQRLVLLEASQSEQPLH